MIRLISCPKTYSSDQDKAVSPAHTLREVKERLAGVDILAETRRIDAGRLGIPVYLAVCGADALAVMPTRKQMGKGASAEQAEASALMELMERYGFFTFWENLPGVFHATWDEAEARFGDACMPLSQIIQACHDSIDEISARRIMNLRRWNFFPVTRIVDATTVYAPLDLFRRLGEFNGSSAGNTDVESILQGACELIERHTCCLADRVRAALPTIDPASFAKSGGSSDGSPGADPMLADLWDKFQKNGIHVLLKDFSLDMPAPVVAALAIDPATFPRTSEIVFTAGSAANPAKAAIRALTEVAQLAGDFCTSACYEASGLPKFETSEETAWLRVGETIPLSALPCLESDDMLTELRTLAAGLQAKGFTLYSVATTHPKTQVPTHYSFVPGFHFRERDKNASLGLFVGRILTEEAPQVALGVLEEIYPGAHFVPFFRGMIALREQDLSAARALFADAEPRQPEDESRALAAFYHAYTHTLEGQWPDALPGLERAARLCPDMKEYRNLLGVCLFKLGRYTEASTEFSHILTRLDKGSFMDLQNLGLCHYFLGNTAEALHYLEAALAIDPDLEAAKLYTDKLLGR